MRRKNICVQVSENDQHVWKNMRMEIYKNFIHKTIFKIRGINLQSIISYELVVQRKAPVKKKYI